MSFNLASLKTDETAEQEGVLFDYYGGSKLRIARSNNKRAEALRRKLIRDNAMLLDTDDDKNADLYLKWDCQVLAETILLGWEGIEDEEGNPVEATLENRLKAVSEFKDFREDVLRMSGLRDRYKAERNKKDAEDLKG